MFLCYKSPVLGVTFSYENNKADLTLDNELKNYYDSMIINLKPFDLLGSLSLICGVDSSDNVVDITYINNRREVNAIARSLISNIQFIMLNFDKFSSIYLSDHKYYYMVTPNSIMFNIRAKYEILSSLRTTLCAFSSVLSALGTFIIIKECRNRKFLDHLIECLDDPSNIKLKYDNDKVYNDIFSKKYYICFLDKYILDNYLEYSKDITTVMHIKQLLFTIDMTNHRFLNDLSIYAR